MLKLNNFKRLFSTLNREMVKQQILNTTAFQDDALTVLVESQSFKFAMAPIDPPRHTLMVHRANTPASLLLKNHLHLFPPQMTQFNKDQSYKAFQRLVKAKYDSSFSKCKSPAQVFHLSRRIKAQIRAKQRYIGVIDDSKPKYKGYLPLWSSYRQAIGARTLKQYQQNGVQIKQLKQPFKIIPTGELWLPTRQNYLAPFLQIVKQSDKIQKSNTVLDIGCGSGVLSFLLAKSVKSKPQIIGIDLNKSAVQTSNINGIHLGIHNFRAIQADITALDQNSYRILAEQNSLPKVYDLMICNPPWIVAKKMNSQKIGLEDGVYDHQEKFLKSSLQFARANLEKKGRLILIYSSLSLNLGLSKLSIQQHCAAYGLRIAQRQQIPYTQKLQSQDELSRFKQQSNITAYQIVLG